MLFTNAVQHCKWCYTKLLGGPQAGQTFHKGAVPPWSPSKPPLRSCIALLPSCDAVYWCHSQTCISQCADVSTCTQRWLNYTSHIKSLICQCWPSWRWDDTIRLVDTGWHAERVHCRLDLWCIQAVLGVLVVDRPAHHRVTAAPVPLIDVILPTTCTNWKTYVVVSAITHWHRHVHIDSQCNFIRFVALTLGLL